MHVHVLNGCLSPLESHTVLQAAIIFGYQWAALKSMPEPADLQPALQANLLKVANRWGALECMMLDVGWVDCGLKHGGLALWEEEDKKWLMDVYRKGEAGCLGAGRLHVSRT